MIITTYNVETNKEHRGVYAEDVPAMIKAPNYILISDGVEILDHQEIEDYTYEKNNNRKYKTTNNSEGFYFKKITNVKNKTLTAYKKEIVEKHNAKYENHIKGIETQYEIKTAIDLLKLNENQTAEIKIQMQNHQNDLESKKQEIDDASDIQSLIDLS